MFRRSAWFVFAAVSLSAALIGCGYGSGMNNPNAAAPMIAQLQPNSAMHGAQQFTLTVNGNNFSNVSVVYFNGSPLVTSYSTTTQITAQVPAADVAAAGMVQVYVSNNGQISNIVIFTVQ